MESTENASADFARRSGNCEQEPVEDPSAIREITGVVRLSAP